MVSDFKLVVVGFVFLFSFSFFGVGGEVLLHGFNCSDNIVLSTEAGGLLYVNESVLFRGVVATDELGVSVPYEFFLFEMVNFSFVELNRGFFNGSFVGVVDGNGTVLFPRRSYVVYLNSSVGALGCYANGVNQQGVFSNGNVSGLFQFRVAHLSPFQIKNDNGVYGGFKGVVFDRLNDSWDGVDWLDNVSLIQSNFNVPVVESVPVVVNVGNVHKKKSVKSSGGGSGRVVSDKVVSKKRYSVNYRVHGNLTIYPNGGSTFYKWEW